MVEKYHTNRDEQFHFIFMNMDSCGSGSPSVHPVSPLFHFLEGGLHTVSSILTASDGFVPSFREDRGDQRRAATSSHVHISSSTSSVSTFLHPFPPTMERCLPPAEACLPLVPLGTIPTWQLKDCAPQLAPLYGASHTQYLISMLSAFICKHKYSLVPNCPSGYCNICLLRFKHGVPEMPTFTFAIALLSSCPTSFSLFHHSPKDSFVLKPIINAQP